MAGVLDVLLDLPLLPTGRRIAELGLEQEVADHGREARVDLPLLTPSHLVDGGSHVVVDAAPGNAAEHAESVIMGVKQHLVGLLRISAKNKGAAVRQLEVGDLQFAALAGDDRPVFCQSNWNASSAENASGTKTPRALVFCSRWRAAFHSRAKAATRL